MAQTRFRLSRWLSEFGLSRGYGSDAANTMPEGARVAIIGAGAAGLYAGKTLHDRNVDCTIFEASNRIGGRLGKSTALPHMPVDLGAEWIHGHRTLTYKLAKKAGAEILEDESELALWFDNRLSDERDMPKAFRSLYAKAMKCRGPDKDLTLTEWAVAEGLPEEQMPLLPALANDSGGSADRMSVYAAIREESRSRSGDDDYKVRDWTYFDLVEKLVAAPIADRIETDAPVEKIAYDETGVTLTIAGAEHRFDRAIITSSVNILKSGIIAFEPALPAPKIEAIGKIGMEAGHKMFLAFTADFFGSQEVIGGAIGNLYYDARIGKSSDRPTIGVFTTGERAQAMSDMGREGSIAAVIDDLDRIFGSRASETFTGETIVQDWTTEPYVRGGYSYPTVGMGDARETLAEPVADRLFFAGEAAHSDGESATVHGAMKTGERAALEAIRSFAR
ncbi:MAG: flavin monoamine oxidase family protein [Parasphingopyxis sp.]|uniref:flavin monoamine oxidase family protein n=1 Tax=Parasphingopyxis sp. TaxID=1920299 RepID=UPI003FA0F2B7